VSFEEPKRDPSYAESFTPMPEPPAPAPEPEYTASVESLRQAGRDLQDGREVEAPTITREYQNLAGDNKGERRTPNETVDIHRAAADLAQIRRDEAESAEFLASQEFQLEVDADRLSQPPVQQPDLQQQQPEAQSQIPGVDPEVAKALENPKIREAINQQIQQSVPGNIMRRLNA